MERHGNMLVTHKMKWGDCLSHQIWPYIEKGWKDDSDRNINFFWGLGANNIGLIRECERLGEEWWYVDVGYFTEQITRYPKPIIHDKDYTYFRIVKGGIHTQAGILSDGKRLDELTNKGIVGIYPGWAEGRKKILVCPSSPTVTYYINNISQEEWIDKTVKELKKHTKREIVVRNKPRPGNKWWNKPITEDLKDTYCLVTNMSLSAIDAVTNNVPAITDEKNVASSVTTTDLSMIETPYKPNVKAIREWMTVMSEHQFTLNEIGSGVAYEALKRQYENKVL